jgi:hypothetical protein
MTSMAYLHNVSLESTKRMLCNILLVLALSGESELVLGLSVRDLVDTEPLVGGTEETGHVALDVLNVYRLSVRPWAA